MLDKMSKIKHVCVCFSCGHMSYHQQSRTPSRERGWGFLYTEFQPAWTCPVSGNRMPEEHREMKVKSQHDIVKEVFLTNSGDTPIPARLRPPHQVVLGLGHVGVVGAQFGLVDLQRSHVVVLHLFVLALVLTQQGQVVQLLGHIWVVLPQHLGRNQVERGGG